MRIGLFGAMLSFLLMLGLPTASFGGALLGDTDGDGVDDLLDVCLLAPNAAQIDSDGDGCGNACDGDYDQNGKAGITDFAIFRSAFGKSLGDPGYRPETDHDANDATGITDFAFFRSFFGNEPGPSKLPTRDLPLCP